MRGRHKKWADPYLSAHPEIVFESIDPQDPFFKASSLFLEIGTGKGDFILKMPSLIPGHYLGLERDHSILGLAAKKAVDLGRDDIRLSPLDFDVAFEAIKDLRFDGVFLNFSDPWPKKRHTKRRLTTKERLLQMKSLLKDDGKIVFKSDNENLYLFTLEEAPLAGLAIILNDPDYQGDPLDAVTEYEANFRSKHLPIHRIIMVKEK